MAFREKSAWITVVTLTLLSGFLITHAPGVWALRPEPGGCMIHVLHVGVIAFVAIEMIAHTLIAIRSPKEALAPKDERERLIALKATRIAACICLVLTILSMSTVHTGANETGLVYLVLYSFIISQIVKYAARIVYYRRGI